MRAPLVFTYLLCLVLSGTARSQTAIAPIGSVPVELFGSLRTQETNPGQVLRFRSEEPLQVPGCALPQNTEIDAKVDSFSRVAEGPGSILVAIRFAPVKCSGKSSGKVLPLLVAIQNHPEGSSPAHVKVSTAAFNYLVSGAMNTMIGLTHNNDAMLATRDAMNSGLHDQQDADLLKAGEVRGIRGLLLQLPEFTPVTTLLFAHDQILPGPETTYFLAFVPAPDLSSESSSATETALPEDTEVCQGSGCAQLLAPTAELGNRKVLWSVKLAPLGFTARPDARVTKIEHDAGIHFLGQDQILLTFPLHTLLKRSAQAGLNTRSRILRAVLVSRQDGHVLQQADWEVPEGPGPYVWSLGSNAVLVQIGSDLAMFGPNLEQDRKFTLPGPLASLIAAPSGEGILLTTVHEKHTPKDHQDLVNMLGPDRPVSENYDLIALDAYLSPTAKRLVYGSVPQVALLGGAIVSAQTTRTDVWQINRTALAGNNAVLATVRSTCPVHVSSLPGHLVLAEGCGSDPSHGTWLRVLNEKGATLLQGAYDRSDLVLQADMDAAATEFGLASVHLDPPAKEGTSAPANHSVDEAVEVYRSSDGKLQFAAKLTTNSAEQNYFKISPEGDALAAFTNDQVQLFQLP